MKLVPPKKQKLIMSIAGIYNICLNDMVGAPSSPLFDILGVWDSSFFNVLGVLIKSNGP